ncbi:DUF4954 family protein, partial [Treponema pallidum]
MSKEEIHTLIQKGNHCDTWHDVLVADPFDASLIRNSSFAGLVRIASLERRLLRYHDFTVPTGITHSTLISCDVGENCAIHHCAYISHYIIGNHVILSRIDELCTTNHAKFGAGIIKDGEQEAVRITIDPLNETGGRKIFPFVGMIAADAFLWACHRDRTLLMQRFESMTQQQHDTRRGYYGTIETQSVIKSCRIIKDVCFGPGSYVKGANKLKNLTVQSSLQEPTQIGEGVELVNGVIGYGCRVFYGVKAVRFVLGNNCALKYGTRLIHSVLGDNSTISCCEVLNALIFPYHEQHHNNSFLIAALIRGQSNIAAGSTIGSNHNTRKNDGEIIAGRGFWSGLASTLKHNCRFASFVLITGKNYPAELDIPFPFSLVTNNERENRLEIMPAYYWLYNMYAIERNEKKFAARDKRKTKTQTVEISVFAPDTIGEIENALALLDSAIERAWVNAGNSALTAEDIVLKHPTKAQTIPVLLTGIEHSTRSTLVLKPLEARKAYRDILIWYCTKTLLSFFEQTTRCISHFTSHDPKTITHNWVNMGGQLVPEDKFETLLQNIETGKFKSWHHIHKEYDALAATYETDKALHAYAVLCSLARTRIDAPLLCTYVQHAITIEKYRVTQIHKTRCKDYLNPFREITYRNPLER